jgi:hypothetical protein
MLDPPRGAQDTFADLVVFNLINRVVKQRNHIMAQSRQTVGIVPREPAQGGIAYERLVLLVTQPSLPSL